MSVAVIWHYWLAVALAVPAILLVVTVAVLYVVKVEMPRFNREDQPMPDEYEALAARKALEGGKG
jgi:hypothetical protein